MAAEGRKAGQVVWGLVEHCEDLVSPVSWEAFSNAFVLQHLIIARDLCLCQGAVFHQASCQ